MTVKWSFVVSTTPAGARDKESAEHEDLRDHYSPRIKWTVPPALGLTYGVSECSDPDAVMDVAIHAAIRCVAIPASDAGHRLRLLGRPGPTST